MGLKSIEIQGFKSFKDKITLDFNHSITAIVGPNGSGKSNISDAILWVLGEQSAKTLRGNKMQDVIFAGTERIKPVNVCQVSMTFEKDQYLNIPYEEATVMRRVYRTGESEYYINRTQVRLKDVREFFMDTGIGKEGYSVIGQGKIDQILSAKTDEIRHIFEEASGISKSKYKKEESIKKLKKMNENLARIEDILLPQRDRLQFLKKEKDKAVRGLELTEIIKTNEIIYAKEEISKIREKEKAHHEKHQILKDELSDDEKEKEQLFKEKAPLEEKIHALNEKLTSYTENEIQSKSELERIQYELSLLEEKNKFSVKDQQRIQKEQEEVSSKCSQIDQSITEQKEKYQKDYAHQEGLKSEIQKQQKLLDEKKEQLNSLQERKRECSIELFNVQEKIKELTVRKETRASVQKIQSQKKDLILKDIKEMDEKIRDFHMEISKVQEEITDIKKEWEEKEKSALKTKMHLEKIDETLQTLNQDEMKQKEQIREKEHRLSILENSIRSREGFYYAVQNFFKQRKNTPIESITANPLAELIRAKKGYEKVIEILLQSVVQNIVVQTKNDARDCIEFLKTKKIGRLTFLPIDSIHARQAIHIEDSYVHGVASDFVESDAKIRNIIGHFLNQTLIVSTMEDAIKLSKKYPRHRIATIDGDLINTSGSMVGGYKKEPKGDSILNRNQQFIDQKKEVQKLLKTREEIKKEIEASYSEQENIKNLLNQFEEYTEEYQRSEKILSEKLFVKQQELKYLQLERDKINKEYEQIEKEQSNEVDDENEINRLKERENELKSWMNDDESTLESERFEMEFALNNLRNQYDLTQRDVLLLNNRIKDLEDEKFDYLRKKEQLQNDSTQFKEEFLNHEQMKKKLQTQKEELSIAIRKLQNALPGVKKDRADFIEKSRFMNERSSEIEKRIELNTFRLETMGQEKIRFIEERKKIEEMIQETYGFNIMDQVDEKVQKISKAKLYRFKEELRSLGPYSVDMIEEYQLIQKEVDFLEKQKEDLCIARKDIDTLIAELDSDMKSSFKVSFDAINDRFNHIFQTLFQGGKAELILQGTDYLASNIEIVAKPPGKKLQSLSLLSGGERSLTAICLLFAIFETKPSSFCLLDEIDAALDELNIHRFKNYLIKFSEQTQFLIITHRKSTMEMAEVLYGVSMEEQGISKVIELNLGEKNAKKII